MVYNKDVFIEELILLFGSEDSDSSSDISEAGGGL